MGFTRYTKPALVGGALMGVLSALPFVNFLNCFCCAYVWGGSILATYLLFKDAAEGTLSDGALTGLLSGIIGAIVSTVVGLPVMFLMKGQMNPLDNMPLEAVDREHAISAKETAELAMRRFTELSRRMQDVNEYYQAAGAARLS